MDESDASNLDNEFKRYLQIMRPYLGQLLDENVIEVCNAWIKRLSSCSDGEKGLRNKYIFALCYQLAKGIIDEPFLKHPPTTRLPPLSDELNSDESSTEVECLVIDSDSPTTKVIYNNPLKTPLTVQDEQTYDTETHSNTTHNIIKRSECFSYDENECPSHKQNIFCYTCPEIYYTAQNEHEEKEDKYKQRAANLVLKLRQIKEQNLLLQTELLALRKESSMQYDDSHSGIQKVNHATSTNISTQSSFTNINSLKNRLQELQDSRNDLIDTIANLQEKLDFFDETKKREIDDLAAKHKLEIINIKKAIREEVSTSNETKLAEIRRNYEETITALQNSRICEIENLTQNKDCIIEEKDKIIQSKDLEIMQLRNQMEEIKRNQYSVINRLLDKPDTSDSSSSKTEELERRLTKMEKARSKSTKAYEAKLAHLQRQKHLAECSLQLQLIKQRNQVINEVTDENQVELSTALDKLEGKYKELVANVQATAVQRRIQDQLALDSIIQAICGVRESFTNSQAACQLAGKTMRSKNGNQSGDVELSTLFHGNKVGNVVVGKSFGEDSVVNEYCLDSGKLGQVFDRVHIPQRDTGDAPTKK